MSERYDVGALYERSNSLERVCRVFFWTNCVVTVLALWPSAIQDAVVVLQFVTAILYVLVGLVNDCKFWFDAESANRKHLLEDALGIDITNRQSVGYYNNRFGKSVERCIANAFESSFFSMNVSEAMLPRSVVKSVVAVVILLLFLYVRPASVSLSDATQAVMSAYLVEDTVLLAVFHSKVKSLYSDFYKSLVSVGVDRQCEILLLLSSVQEYECTKAFFKVRLDSNIFHRINPRLTKEWEGIQERIRFC